MEEILWEVTSLPMAGSRMGDNGVLVDATAAVTTTVHRSATKWRHWEEETRLELLVDEVSLVPAPTNRLFISFRAPAETLLFPRVCDIVAVKAISFNSSTISRGGCPSVGPGII